MTNGSRSLSGTIACCSGKYERSIGKEKVEWPVTEIVVSSLKKLGKAEKSEGAGGPTGGSEFSEEITDADVPF